jgi:carboxyl-terminal processing protease
MPAWWIDAASPASASFLVFLAVVALKTSLVLAIGGLAAWVCRRSSASTRHLVWSLAFCGCLVLPALTASLPSWLIQIEIPVTRATEGTELAFRIDPEGNDEPILVASRTTAHKGPASIAPPWSSGVLPAGSAELRQTEMEVSMRSIDFFAAWGALGVVSLWLAGALVCAGPLALGFLSLRRLRQNSLPVDDAETIELAETQAARLGVHRTFRLLRSARRDIPMTWGVFRPIILLPDDSLEWSQERLAIALAHELAHIKRLDCLTQLLARFVCAANWFNPLAWFALVQIRAEQEQASDDLAINGEFDAPAYAGHLLAIVAGRDTSGREAIVARAMASASRLERRVVGILDPGADRRPVGRGRAGLLALTAACLVTTVAIVNLSTVAQARPIVEAEVLVDDPPKKVDSQAEVLEAVRESSIKPPDESALKLGAIKGILEALNDPYSMFVDAEEIAQFERNMEGKLTGIGAQLELKDDQPSVIAPVPDSPAAKAGIKPGDLLIEVDGKPTKGVGLTEVVKQIVGPAGTTVKIQVKHPDDKVETLALVRGVISYQTITGYAVTPEGRPDYLLDPRRGIGYVRIHQFTNGTSKGVKAAIESLKARELKGLILDLRACPGGLMSEAVDTAKLFLDKGTIVKVRGRDKAETVSSADGSATAPDVPLIVLINRETASAAEIVAGALKDNDRAVVVGDRSFGKGSVQSIIKLKDGGAIRITTAYYELPRGENIDRAKGKESWGVDPTDGYYIPSRYPARFDDFARKRPIDASQLETTPVTPSWIEYNQLDPVLAGGFRTLIARTTTGAFVKVGRPAAEITDRERSLEANRRRRKAVLEELNRLDREISELSRESSGESPR